MVKLPPHLRLMEIQRLLVANISANGKTPSSRKETRLLATLIVPPRLLCSNRRRGDYKTRRNHSRATTSNQARVSRTRPVASAPHPHLRRVVVSLLRILTQAPTQTVAIAPNLQDVHHPQPRAGSILLKNLSLIRERPPRPNPRTKQKAAKLAVCGWPVLVLVVRVRLVLPANLPKTRPATAAIVTTHMVPATAAASSHQHREQTEKHPGTGLFPHNTVGIVVVLPRNSHHRHPMG